MTNTDTRTFSQRWADRVTEFSGSWLFIWLFIGVCAIWIIANQMRWVSFDLYPFLFLNWTLTIISTLQNPLILLSQNRQNENDRQTVKEQLQLMREIKQLLEQRE
jgi:uncharacterized membrane protein